MEYIEEGAAAVNTALNSTKYQNRTRLAAKRYLSRNAVACVPSPAWIGLLPPKKKV